MVAMDYFYFSMGDTHVLPIGTYGKEVLEVALLGAGIGHYSLGI